MKKSKNTEVQNYLDKTMRTDPGKYALLIRIREIIFDTFPDINEKIMYGGIVFFSDNEMFSGLFVNKKHLTLEFSKGFLMDDPNDNLEGTGKYRRHLKIFGVEDIKKKDLDFYVKQAI